MKKFTAPGTLTRRGTKAEINGEIAAARAFADHMKDEIVKELKLTTDLPHADIEAAARVTSITTFVGTGEKSYWRAKEDKPVWMHVWEVQGGFRSEWSSTKMVIRTDGTVNTEYLASRIARIAREAVEYRRDQAAKAAVIEAMGGYTPPEGYEVEATPHFVAVTYVGPESYTSSLKLRNVLCPTDKVEALIAAHSRWVADYLNIMKGA